MKQPTKDTFGIARRTFLLSVALLSASACQIDGKTYKFTPLAAQRTSTQASSQQPNPHSPEMSVTIIDEFDNDANAAIQKYQQYHVIKFVVKDISVSGESAVLSYWGQPTSRSEWANKKEFQGWSSWMKQTQKSFYRVACVLPVSGLSAFPDLKKDDVIQLQAKLHNYGRSEINLVCRP